MNDVSLKLEHLWRRLFDGTGKIQGSEPRESGHLDRLFRSYHRILLVLDRGDAPDAVVRDLLARVEGVRLELVVIRVLPEWCQKHLEGQARADLHRLASGLTSVLHRVVGEVRLGDPVEQVLRAATDHAVELIVLAAARRGLLHPGLDRSMLLTILRESPIPVLMLRDEASVEMAPAQHAR
jgi:nucleotide-binding universal stress UspA family protein